MFLIQVSSLNRPDNPGNEWRRGWILKKKLTGLREPKSCWLVGDQILISFHKMLNIFFKLIIGFSGLSFRFCLTFEVVLGWRSNYVLICAVSNKYFP